MHYVNYDDDYKVETFLRDLLGLYKDRSHLAAMFFNDLDKIKQAYALMSDEMSRRMFISYLLSHLFKALSSRTLFKFFAEYHQDDRYNNDCIDKYYGYFIPEIQSFYDIDPLIKETFIAEQYCYRAKNITVEEGDICLDFGAFIGDTALWMSRSRNAKQVYAFEFSEQAYSLLLKNLDYNGDYGKRITPVKKAVSNRNDPLPIERNQFGVLSSGTDVILDAAKYIAKYGKDSPLYVEAITVDTFCKENHIEPDFIKADIEGAERMLIGGAHEVLSQVKPTIAMSAYHFPNDLYELPLLIHKHNSQYQFFMHRPDTELVLFAC